MDLEEVSSLQRVRNSGSLFQSNVCDLFSRGFSCCPFYRGVRKARVDCNTLIDRSLQPQISWGPPRPHPILRTMHVEYTGNKISTRLGTLHRTHKVLPKSTCLMLYSTIVLPLFDYCWSIWDSCGVGSKSYLDNLSLTDVAPVSLKVDQSGLAHKRVDYLKCVLVYKCLYGMAPLYF